MRKKIIICLWLLSCVAAAGQSADKQVGVKQPSAKPGPPDLSGSWVLDKSRSDVKFLFPTPGQDSMTVVHREPEVRITERLQLGARDVVRTLVYYTDGRGEKNVFKAGAEGLKTKTRWKGRRLVSERRQRENLQGYVIDIFIKDSWELSEDGDTLVRALTTVAPPPRTTLRGTVMPNSEMTIRMVFKRAN